MENLATPSIVSGQSNQDRLKRRDYRIDACRGFALVMILIDHIPGNALTMFTMWQYGFCDASELFVFLSGFSVWLAYGRLLEKPSPTGGWKPCLKKIARRWSQIYVYQFVTVVMSVLFIRGWVHTYGGSLPMIEPTLVNSWQWLRSFALLRALPQTFNILQLYCVLLAFVSFIFALYRIHAMLLVVVSATLWICANHYPWMNLHNGFNPNGWYFNPIGWQFIFVIGMLTAIYIQKRGGNLPAKLILRLFCFAFLIFAFIQSFSFEYWGLTSRKIFGSMIYNDKTPLGLWRCIDALCLMYLLLSSKRASAWSHNLLGRFLSCLGRNSLEVFCTGTIVCIISGALISHFGYSFWYQIAANGFVLSVALIVATVRDRMRRLANQRLELRVTEVSYRHQGSAT